MGGFSKWAILDADVYDGDNGEPRKVFDPHVGQLVVLEDTHPYQVVIAGRRFGKSFLGGNELLPEAALTRRMASSLKRDGKRREFWIVGPEYSDAEKEFRVFYNQCTRLQIPFDKPGTYYSAESGSMSVSLWDGAFIVHGKSAKFPERLVGEGLSGVIMSEAAKQKERIWTQYIRPTLSDFDGWAKFTTTPEGKNWLYDLFMKALPASNPNWWAYRGPAWRNNHVYKEPTNDAHVKFMLKTMHDNPGVSSYEVVKSFKLVIDSRIVDMANDLSGPEFSQEICAEFTDFVGKVFGDFDDELHVQELDFHTESNWRTVAAVDYGFTEPNVWLLIQIGPWGEINILDEIYISNLAPDEFAHEIIRRQLLPPGIQAFYPDPALPGYTKTLETIFRKNGSRIKAKAHTGGKLDDRLNLIRLALRNRIVDHDRSMPQWIAPSKPDGSREPDIRRPQIMIHPRCVNTIHEFNEYRYAKKKDNVEIRSAKNHEVPLDQDNHTPEALGRFFASEYHDVASQYGGSGSRMSRAQFVRNIGGKKQTRQPAPVARSPWTQS